MVKVWNSKLDYSTRKMRDGFQLIALPDLHSKIFMFPSFFSQHFVTFWIHRSCIQCKHALSFFDVISLFHFYLQHLYLFLCGAWLIKRNVNCMSCTRMITMQHTTAPVGNSNTTFSLGHNIGTQNRDLVIRHSQTPEWPLAPWKMIS